MVDMTLKDGVEVSLLAQVPELTAIRDVTDHSVTENAYM
jgi:Fe/S biogenesis protein NfuA